MTKLTVVVVLTALSGKMSKTGLAQVLADRTSPRAAVGPKAGVICDTLALVKDRSRKTTVNVVSRPIAMIRGEHCNRMTMQYLQFYISLTTT